MNAVRYNESELNAEMVFRRIMKMRLYIILFVSLATAVSIIYVSKLKNQYMTKTVLRSNQNLVDLMPPVTVTTENIDSLAGIQKAPSEKVRTYAILYSLLYGADTISDVVIDGGFERPFFNNNGRFLKSKKYRQNRRYYILSTIQQNISLEENAQDRTITLSFRTTDREDSQRFMYALLDELGKRYKALEDKPLEREISFYSDKIKEADSTELRNALTVKTMALIHNRALAMSGRYYGFDVIKPPLVQDKMKTAGPPRIKICVLVFFGSLILSVMCVSAYDILIQRKRSFK